MNELAKGTCIPCKGGVPPLKGEELEVLMEKLGNSWKIIKEHHLEKEYLFVNFREALDIKPSEVLEELGGLPDEKVHCCSLGPMALENAINDYILSKLCESAL